MRKERVGFAVCGSFCTHEKVLKALEALTGIYETVIPIVSEISAFTDTRFGTSEDLLERLEESGTVIAQTARYGAITVDFAHDGVRVSAFCAEPP